MITPYGAATRSVPIGLELSGPIARSACAIGPLPVQGSADHRAEPNGTAPFKIKSPKLQLLQREILTKVGLRVRQTRLIGHMLYRFVDQKGEFGTTGKGLLTIRNAEFEFFGEES